MPSVPPRTAARDVCFLGNRGLGGYETPREAVEFVARKADEPGL